MGLYLTFIIVGVLLFAFVYFYSTVWQKKRRVQRGDSSEPSTERTEPLSIPEPTVDEGVTARIDPVLTGSSSANSNQTSSLDINPSADQPDIQPKERVEPSMAPVSGATAAANPAEPKLAPDSFNSTTEPVLDSAQDQQAVQQGSEEVAEELAEDNVAASSSDNEQINGEPESAVLREEQQQQLFEVDDSDGGDAEATASSAQGFAPSQSPSGQTYKSIELVARIPGEQGVPRDGVLAIFRKYDFLFARKLHLYGFNTLTQVWADVEREDESAVFGDLGISLQLADKTGAMTRKELNALSQLVLAVAEEYDRQFTFSMDLDEAIEIGRNYDELGRKHNAMVVLNIVPKRRDGFRSSDLDSCTRDLEMAQSANGVFTRYGIDQGKSRVRYHIAVADQEGQFRPVKKTTPFRVFDVVVYMNVPIVEDPSDAFETMVDEARKLATWLDGKLVDKHRRNMTTKGIKILAGQVSDISGNMRKDGLEPGSLLCQKLF